MMSVHPHMRGEDFNLAETLGTQAGSPPHAWGRPSYTHRAALNPRFTPTCVGKTGSFGSDIGEPPVHPHMRGEDSSTYRAPPSGGGSPPHAWGRRKGIGILPGGLRFTPTCVGKTRPDQSPAPPPSVHPHMRGEDDRNIPFLLLVFGSPPHAWGRREPAKGGRIIWRFTPTCVGKTGVSAL